MFVFLKRSKEKRESYTKTMAMSAAVFHQSLTWFYLNTYFSSLPDLRFKSTGHLAGSIIGL